MPPNAAINCEYTIGNATRKLTTTGAADGDVHNNRMSIIAIVGTERSTATTGRIMPLNGLLAAASEERTAARTNDSAKDMSVRNIVIPNARQNSAPPNSENIAANVSQNDGMT